MSINVYVGSNSAVSISGLGAIDISGGIQPISVSNITGVVGTYCIMAASSFRCISDSINLPNTTYRATWTATTVNEDMAFTTSNSLL